MLAQAIREIEIALTAVCKHGGHCQPVVDPVSVKAAGEVVELHISIPGLDFHRYPTLVGAAMKHVQNNASLPLRIRDASLEPLAFHRYLLMY